MKIQSLRDSFGGAYIKPKQETVDAFINNLHGSDRAKQYLENERGLKKETIANFRLGYDPDRDAISIPVYKKNELVNIRYRFISPPKGKPKYTQEKGCEIWVYNDVGFDEARKKRGVMIVEGEFDLMTVWQNGIKNVISPASGKDSYGVWIEELDTIDKVYIAYDNDKPGKTSALNIAERLGVEKCYEVVYPEGIKDANEYFLSGKTIEDFRDLIKKAKAFFKYTYEGVAEIIEKLMTTEDDNLYLKLLPDIEIGPDWIAVVSGRSNAGKTTYVLNIANELADRNIPTLILPFERGIKTVGKRFLQVRYDKENREFNILSKQEWDELIKDASNLPIYFAMPKNEEIRETVIKSKKLFNTKVVIVDHLNYLVRMSNNNENVETSRTLQEFKAIAQEYNMIFIIVHHIKKVGGFGVKQKLGMEDLKGSSSVYQDPEAVIMISSGDDTMTVDVVKNKGIMGETDFPFNARTGKVTYKKSKPHEPLPYYTNKELDEIFDDF